MLKFPIPPEYCLIINAFSQASTLRGAAALLGMDPPALVRKVRRLSEDFGYLQKVGSRWTLTEAGLRVAQWTDEFINSQSYLAQEKSQIRIAAYAWLAEEMLIPKFDDLNARSNQSWVFKVIGPDLEKELIHSRSDLVIHGLSPNDPAIAHKKIVTYSWVVVVPYSWKKNLQYLNQNELVEFLQKKKFVRHSGMNIDNVLEFKLTNFSQLSVDGVIGLRSAIISEHGWSVLPTMSIQSAVHEKKIYKLSMPTLIKDEVSVWWLRARKDMGEQAKVVARWISELKVE